MKYLQELFTSHQSSRFTRFVSDNSLLDVRKTRLVAVNFKDAPLGQMGGPRCPQIPSFRFMPPWHTHLPLKVWTSQFQIYVGGSE